MNKRELATRVAWMYHGRPYRWGGDDPMEGFDCSGYVIEILQSVGALPRRGDWTAQGLYERFAHMTSTQPAEGRLVFWADNGRVVHVEYCLDDTFSIGASGGGSQVRSEADAIKHDAYIKVRPIMGRGRTIVGYVDPIEQLEG